MAEDKVAAIGRILHLLTTCSHWGCTLTAEDARLLAEELSQGGGHMPLPPTPATPPPAPKKKFVRPSVEEVRAYCQERGNSIDPDRFVNYYEANGWRVGKAPMKDWKAAVRNWENNERERASNGKQRRPLRGEYLGD